MNIKKFSTFVVSLLIATQLNAKTVSLNDISNMPASIEKDFYIWTFISNPNTTIDDANSAISQIYNVNSLISKAYSAKTGNTIKQGIKCTTPDCVPPPPSKSTQDAKKYFSAGIKAVILNDLENAKNYFAYSKQLADRAFAKDQATFWLYLVTKDKTYLNELTNSKDINMYTLVANDIAGNRYPSILHPIYDKDSKDDFDIKDPIQWVRLKERLYKPNANLDDLAKEYETTETLAHNTFIKAYASGYTENYFPLPYRQQMENMSLSRQALIYSIARQESRFIPASISRSYALGMMQMMPFLVKHIANEKGEPVELDKMFDPQYAISYADYHLNWLNRTLQHPLFVAYAYNAGIGYTRNLLRKPEMFKSGEFEPYLSMERMENVEAREYGKKVLTNYVIYSNLLGKATRMQPMLNQLIQTEE